jgi:ParB family chromosome partitioning protein
VSAREGGLREIAVDLIDPNPFQARVRFDEAGIEELAASLRTAGVLQPLLVRPVGVRYQVVAGERRWRAAQRAGFAKVPVIVRAVHDQEALELTLIENLQREELNPIEEAQAYERLTHEFGLRQEEVADRTGKNRATVANTIRLLKLPKVVQQLVSGGKLSAGHARALLMTEDAQRQVKLAQRIVSQGLSVRQVERLVKLEGPARPKAQAEIQDPNVKAAVTNLEQALRTKVHITPVVGGVGHLKIEYYSNDQLMDLYDRIMGSAREL